MQTTEVQRPASLSNEIFFFVIWCFMRKIDSISVLFTVFEKETFFLKTKNIIWSDSTDHLDVSSDYANIWSIELKIMEMI